MNEVLSLAAVTKSYDSTQVLKGVNLRVHAGEVMGLVGENGVGKSTLMAILTGEVQQDGGEITFRGEHYSVGNQREALARGISVIQQHPRIDPKLSVAEAIYRNHPERREGGDVHRQTQEFLDSLGLDLRAEARVDELSPAQRNMIEIARVYIEDAQLIIMDEVTATFNPEEVRHLREIICIMTARGKSVIYISHRLQEVRAIATKVAVLVNGHISNVFDTSTVTADHIADAMLTRSYRDQRSREGHVQPEIMLSARSMSCPDLVHDVSFDIHRGEVFGLVGSRRSGASQIAGMLIGEVSGSIEHLEFRGQSHKITSPAEAAALGIAYFSDAQDELGLDVEETIARSLLSEGSHSEDDFRAEVVKLREIISVIQTMDIKAKSIRNTVGTLSGGDQQKVALSRWMRGDHPLLILNNPCRGIDVGSRREIYNAVAEQTAQGNSVLLLSHDITELLEWCDRIAVVRDGRIQAVGTASDFDEEELARAMSRRGA